MTAYIIRRLLLVPILLFGVTILIFGMLQFSNPGGALGALRQRHPQKLKKPWMALLSAMAWTDPLYVQILALAWSVKKIRSRASGWEASYSATLDIRAVGSSRSLI